MIGSRLVTFFRTWAHRLALTAQRFASRCTAVFEKGAAGRIVSASFRGALTAALFLCAFPPLVPRPCDLEHEGTLDWSWRIAINHARHYGLDYGKDIVFTYGPLGFVACPLDVGNNVLISVIFRLLIHAIGVSVVCGCAWRCRTTSGFLTIILVAAFSGCWQEVEKTAIVATIGCLILAWHLNSRSLIGLAGFLWAFGSLLKFSTGLGCGGAVAVWAASVLMYRRSESLRSIALVGTVFLASTALLFRMFGGPLDGFPAWLRYSWLVSSGYTQMTMRGPTWELGLGLFEMALVIWAGWCCRRDRGCILAFLLIAPALFLNFKHGFVRQDGFHAPLFFISVPLLACFLLPDARRRFSRLAATTACIALLMMSITHRLIYLAGPEAALWSAYWSPRAFVLWHHRRSMSKWTEQAPNQILPEGYWNLKACKNWQRHHSALDAAWAKESLRAKLPAGVRAKIGTERVDAYPWDVYLPVMNCLNWCPRPILQSYSAYTPALDKLGALHYSSRRGPTFILYRHQAIDGEHPLLVDSATWLEMFRWYDVDQQCDRETLLLRRRSTPRFEQPVPAGAMALSFGDRWEVPAIEADEAVILEIDLSTSFSGGLRESAFRVFPPSLFIEYQDGAVEKCRLVWRNLGAGFLVSDLPKDLHKAMVTWNGGRGAPVKAITVLSNPLFHGHDPSFQPMFDIRWSVVRLSDSR